MSHGSRLSRGDSRRNDRLGQLRQIVRREYAVVAIDLASHKQVVAVTDHDSRVLARRTVQVAPAKLGPVLDWAREQALAAGFTGIVVACEPTGHRWKSVCDVAAESGVDAVCVQPMLVARAREAEDFTRDKSDDKDAMLIARLTTQLHVYLPERQHPAWARLRHLGVRRAQQLTRRGAARQQVRDLLDAAWPAALDCARKPLDSMTWLAVMAVIDCDPAVLAAKAATARGRRALTAAISRELPQWGGQRIHTPILTALIAAAVAEPAAADARPGTLERARYALGDYQRAAADCDDVATRMLEVLTELHLATLADSIPGITAVSVAAILAETGDPTRFTSARAVVKHAGLCPRENSSGNYTGTTRISGRGRPRLRLAAWRAVFGALAHNEVYAHRYRHLTTRADNPLTDNQARIAIAAALLRQLHTMITTTTGWNPALAGPAPSTTERTAA
ncbi:IS110 family transposase [Gordonia tangerina]|uniref:IS110 family transposase n=1 Tax=Gordonia tangerina TaxID=2911060 RepID=A0ABS9DUM2_9ACTN|nr:IS110 family transposase [Gordonia tangerina]MCF3941523.1 IS110 family transposase [Gordonia tangerina]